MAGMLFNDERVELPSIFEVFLLARGIGRRAELHFSAAAGFITTLGLPLFCFLGRLFAAIAIHGPLKFADRLRMLLLRKEQLSEHETGPGAHVVARLVRSSSIVAHRFGGLPDVLFSPAKLIQRLGQKR